MPKLVDTLSRYSIILKSTFEATRLAVTDSDVKGSLNETIVAQFLKDTVPNWFISTTSQIVNASDILSDEVDICVCNEHQFFVQPKGGLLIAEGVDFVVQVKARLSDKELDRMIHNCQSVKRAKRSQTKGDTAFVPDNSCLDRLDFIPYICFAFSSELSAETLLERIRSKCELLDYAMQPDAIFVLDRGLTFINGREGNGHPWKNEAGLCISDWIGMQTGDSTLFEFIRFAIQNVPRFNRAGSPVEHYLPKDSTYNVIKPPERADVTIACTEVAVGVHSEIEHPAPRLGDA